LAQCILGCPLRTPAGLIHLVKRLYKFVGYIHALRLRFSQVTSYLAGLLDYLISSTSNLTNVLYALISDTPDGIKCKLNSLLGTSPL